MASRQDLPPSHRWARLRCTVASAALLLAVVLAVSSCQRDQAAGTGTAATAALAMLPAFTDPGVPTTGPAEQTVEPYRATILPELAAKLPGKGLAEHPMLYIGEGHNTMSLVADGRVVWSYSTGKGWEYDDIWLLSDGNVLFSRMSYAEEISPRKEVLWHRDAPPGTEIHSLQPLDRERILMLQNGPAPTVLIIDRRTGGVLMEHILVPPGGAPPGNVHGQFRRIRATAAGTYLISWMSLGKVVEYDRDFKEIWSYATPRPWAAIRLHNGNTLISEESLRLVREVTQTGATAWEFKLSELPPGIPFPDSQSCVRLANGNTVLCSRGDHGKGCQLVEITPDKRVSWALYDWHALGPASAVQLLDDPGIPERPGDLQR